MIKFLLATVLTLLTGCSASPHTAIHHAVFFNLTNPADAAELVKDCRDLGSIPGVLLCSAGAPFDTGRSSVDTAYHAGLCITLDSPAAYQTYLNHPIHTRLVDKWRPRWKSILIRDFALPHRPEPG